MDISSSDPTHQRDQTLFPVLELEVPPTSLATDTLCDPILGHNVATCTARSNLEMDFILTFTLGSL